MHSIGRKLLSLILIFSLMLGTFSGTLAFAAENKAETTKQDSKESYAQEKLKKIKGEQENSVALFSDNTPSGYISTSYIQCYVHENGIYNIGTVDGDCLLFAYPGGSTSQTLIRIDSADYIFSDYVTEITYSSDGKTSVAKATIDDVLVTQTLSIVKNPNSNTENVVSIHYDCKNTSSSSKTIGVRIMMDTMLGNNDGAPFKVKGNAITREVEYRGSNIPTYYQAMDSLSDPSLIATGYFYYSSDEKPDKVQFAHWGSIVGSSWDFRVNTSRDLTGDSAVAAYFNEKTVAAGASRTAVTYYGAYQESVASKYPSFNYDNEAYSQELAELCARYSAYAYQDYQYDSSLDVFYEVKDSGKKEVKNNNHSKVLVDYLKKQGYQNITSENYKNPTENSATYTIARKDVNHNGISRDLILIVIRGTNDIEWQGNMNVTGTSYNGSQDVHDSFQNGAQQIWSRLMRYINTLNSDSKTDNDVNDAMVLITGHSRGGAIGNLLAYELTYNETSQIDESSVYAYLFAVPNVTTANTSGMNNVFNFCFTDDFVPSLPLASGWNYGKYGTTFTATATSQTSTAFLNRHNSSMSKSVKASKLKDRVSFDAARTTTVIDYVKNNWKTVYAYYNQEPWGSTGVRSLYAFMHDVVAPAAMGKIGGTIQLKLYDEKSETCSYTKIANFFVDGMSARASINDTHQMFTYYNALRTGVFNTSTAVAATYQSEVLASAGVECDTTLVQEALVIFANTDSNLEILGWDLTDSSTWTGITLNETGCVTEIDLSYRGLTGGLDLSAFTCLTRVDVSGNELVSLTLPNSETSVLSWLDCSYNNLTSLDISGQPLELLVCTDNYLDSAELEEAASAIPMASYKQQNPIGEIVYSESDVAVLKSNVLMNAEIWDTTADPGTWYGVDWEEIDGVYYVSGLDLAGAEIFGELDVSSLTHLSSLSCNSNEITAIDATGCDELAFLNCCSNDISSILISTSAQLGSLYCADNFLTEDQIAALGAELTVAGHQRILADISSFCENEYNILTPVAQLLEEDISAPGEWFHVTWEKVDGIYHITKLDLSGLEVITGELDLSGFAYLEEVNLSSTGIESVILPDHMTTLNAYAFYDCDALVQVQLPKNLTEIGESAFYSCEALETIIFSAGLKTIGNNAFTGCTALQRLYFPASVEAIGAEAFMNSAELEAAYFTGNAPACGEDAFMFTSVDFTIYYLTDTTGWDNEVWGSYITEEISQFSILVHPEKSIYLVGEELDTTGLTLLLLNTDGTYQIISEGYEVECAPLDAPGDYPVTVNYNDFSVTYEISVRNLSINDANIWLDEYTFDYTGSAIHPEVIVIYDDIELVEGTDYSVSYGENLYPGDGYVYITGIGAYTGEVSIYFEITNEQTYIVSDWTELESEHDYLNSSTVTWIYQAENSDAAGLAITFDENTVFEEGYDVLEIYDGNDELIGSYSGYSLAGQTIIVPGSYVSMTLYTDGSVTYWGFKVVDVREIEIGNLNVVGGTGSGIYEAGEEVIVSAEETQCMQFEYWIAEGIELEDNTSPEITVTMPDSDVTLTAVFTQMHHTSEDGFIDYEPTCTEPGLVFYVCDYCGSEYTEEIPATGHLFEDGYCVECGEPEGSYIPGDINSDGEVNNKDLTRLFQYLSDWDVEVNDAALDINGDGEINNKDLTRLFQYLSDWDVEIY